MIEQVDPAAFLQAREDAAHFFPPDGVQNVRMVFAQAVVMLEPLSITI